ncbi:MAG: hypothetical protein CSA07_02915 [Bacteroidia bacterium]|nr:MAG: hypothetical protein CSA07_02915 [Bacteroidia bacterium]
MNQLHIGLLSLFLYLAYLLFQRFRAGGPFRYSKDSGLSQEQIRALALSASVSLRNELQLNTLALGRRGKKIAHHYLSEWEVSSAEEVRKLLEKRLSAQTSSYMPLIYAAFNLEGKDQAGFLYRASERNQGLNDLLLELTNNLTATYPGLESRGIVSSRADIMRYGLVGWDTRHACMIARAAYEIGYLSERDAWDYINRAQRMARKAFTSWHDFAMSCLISNAVFTGDHFNSDHRAVKKLLKEKHSPWLKYGWE